MNQTTTILDQFQHFTSIRLKLIVSEWVNQPVIKTVKDVFPELRKQIVFRVTAQFTQLTFIEKKLFFAIWER